MLISMSYARGCPKVCLLSVPAMFASNVKGLILFESVPPEKMLESMSS
jgi:hypothetical protein